MRITRNMRPLSGPERSVAKSVFGKSLPNLARVMITDGLGYDDRPYTLQTGPLFQLNLGPDVYPNAVDKSKKFGSDTLDALFVHEMTHVWQYYHNYNVILSSLWANTAGDGYACKAGKPWDDYNVEQQATLVEEWYELGMSNADSRFVYIDKIIRAGLSGSSMVDTAITKLPVDKLKKL